MQDPNSNDAAAPEPVTAVVAGVVLRGDGAVLAGKRPADSKMPLIWEFPGGKVEPGETDAEALRRELREELEIEVEVGAYVGTSTHTHAGRTVQVRAYVCTIVRGTPVAVEHVELRWLVPQDYHEVKWAPADVALLEPVAALARSVVAGDR